MSVRAKRVIKIDTIIPETFNLGYDTTLMEFLEGHGFYSSLNDDGCGISAVNVNVLQEALDTLELVPDLRQAIQSDIDASQGQDAVMYYCY